jgi:hypothetical protein
MPRQQSDAASARRQAPPDRDARRTISARFAADAIGRLKPGCEVFGLTMSKFSLVDLLEHVLSQTGPAEVDLVTWSTANANIGYAYRMLADGRITRFRFVTDYSFPTRHPGYCAALRERFGDDSIRLTKNHAKFVLVRNDRFDLAVRTSMNFNVNPTTEWWEISDSPAISSLLRAYVDDLFQNQTDTFTRPLNEFCTRYGEEWGDCDTETAVNDPRYFGDGPHDVDLRRIGITRRS